MLLNECCQGSSTVLAYEPHLARACSLGGARGDVLLNKCCYQSSSKALAYEP